MKRTQRNHVKVDDQIRITWSTGSLEFIAVGTIEEKPHRLEREDRVRLKLALNEFGKEQGEVFALDSKGISTSLREAGIGWNGWLVVSKDAKYFRLLDSADS